VIAGVKHDPDTLEQMFGAGPGARLVDTVAAGPELVFGLIQKYQINCDATRNGWIQPATSESALTAISARSNNGGDAARRWNYSTAFGSRG